jgi:hypothetical protein
MSLVFMVVGIGLAQSGTDSPVAGIFALIFLSIWVPLFAGRALNKTGFARNPSVLRAMTYLVLHAIYVYWAVFLLVAIWDVWTIVIARRQWDFPPGSNLEDALVDSGFFLPVLVAIILVVLDVPRRWWQVRARPIDDG